jgi:hypothetical protein
VSVVDLVGKFELVSLREVLSDRTVLIQSRKIREAIQFQDRSIEPLLHPQPIYGVSTGRTYQKRITRKKEDLLADDLFRARLFKKKTDHSRQSKSRLQHHSPIQGLVLSLLC